MTNWEGFRHGSGRTLGPVAVLLIVLGSLLPTASVVHGSFAVLPSSVPPLAPHELGSAPLLPEPAAASVPGHDGAAVDPAVVGPASSISVQLSAQPRKGIVPFTVELTASARGSPLASQYNFSWAFGDGSAVRLENVSVSSGATAIASVNHTYILVGTFYTNVTITDGVDASTSASIGITAALPLLITGTANPAAVTSGRPLYLGANATGGVPPYTYIWSGVPAGCGVTGANVTCVPRQVGNYSVQLQVTDSIPIQAFTTVKFSVNPKLVASATYTSWYHCVGTVSYLTDNFSGSAKGGTPPYVYTWNPGDGTSNLTGVNVSHNFTQATTLNVTLSIADHSGAIANRTLAISTSFIACGGLPADNSAVTPLVVGGTIAAAAAVGGLAVVYWRMSRSPPKPKGPLEPAPEPVPPAGSEGEIPVSKPENEAGSSDATDEPGPV